MDKVPETNKISLLKIHLLIYDSIFYILLVALSPFWVLLKQTARIARTISVRFMQPAATATLKRSINYLAMMHLCALVECTLL